MQMKIFVFPSAIQEVKSKYTTLQIYLLFCIDVKLALHLLMEEHRLRVFDIRVLEDIWNYEE
jgi:hypothetical protein